MVSHPTLPKAGFDGDSILHTGIGERKIASGKPDFPWASGKVEVGAAFCDRNYIRNLLNYETPGQFGQNITVSVDNRPFGARDPLSILR